jgi:ribonuclease P protein component
LDCALPIRAPDQAAFDGGHFLLSNLRGMSDEAHLPAEQSRAQAQARLPGPDGHRGWPQGPDGAPQPRPQEIVSLTSAANGIDQARIGKLTCRADFLAANKALRAPSTGFVLLVRPREDGDPQMRLGLTVTKKVGNAVIRNRMKRRLRALATGVLPEFGVAGADHVLIGRQSGIERAFAALRQDLQKSLARLKAKGIGG